jgi:hypothetical protein
MCGGWYCGHFRMTRAVKFFDGDLDRLYWVYKQLRSYEDILMTNSNNIFEEKVLENNQVIEKIAAKITKKYGFYLS